jgi:hypothetical protein
MTETFEGKQVPDSHSKTCFQPQPQTKLIIFVEFQVSIEMILGIAYVFMHVKFVSHT